MNYKKAYQDALNVQDACNLSGVVFSFARLMDELCKEANSKKLGTDWKNTHPLCVLFASKIASLTRCEDSDVFHNAYQLAKKESE